jgi:hypothetical protein
MIKADGNFLAFFARPIACGLGLFTIALWLGMAWFGVRKPQARGPA